MFVHIFCQFLNGIVCSWLFNIYFISYYSSFFVLRILYRLQMQVLNVICRLVNNLSFHFLNGQCLLSKRRHFQFQRSLIYQVFFSFMECTFSFISKKSLPSSRSQRRTPMFASRFIVSDCKCISMSYF